MKVAYILDGPEYERYIKRMDELETNLKRTNKQVASLMGEKFALLAELQFYREKYNSPLVMMDGESSPTTVVDSNSEGDKPRGRGRPPKMIKLDTRKSPEIRERNPLPPAPQ